MGVREVTQEPFRGVWLPLGRVEPDNATSHRLTSSEGSCWLGRRTLPFPITDPLLYGNPHKKKSTPLIPPASLSAMSPLRPSHPPPHSLSHLLSHSL